MSACSPVLDAFCSREMEDMMIGIWENDGTPTSYTVTYSPHLSPFPHSHVLWMSAISLSCLTFRLLKSLSVISATAIDLRVDIANGRP
jgi:hypothetical protein